MRSSRSRLVGWGGGRAGGNFHGRCLLGGTGLRGQETGVWVPGRGICSGFLWGWSMGAGAGREEEAARRRPSGAGRDREISYLWGACLLASSLFFWELLHAWRSDNCMGCTCFGPICAM
jgi:hypothetical protein